MWHRVTLNGIVKFYSGMEILLFFMIIAELFKEGLETGHLNASILDWINVERFPTFPRVSRGNIHQILQTKKFIVLAVVEENKLLEIPTEMLV
jgi:hypothetical protein